MSYLLSFDSPRAEQPNEINIKLREHQLAMLHKCSEIENIEHNIFGIMSDKPSTGKTYVILGLIRELASKKNSASNNNNNSSNIIVVPQNIYTQWILSIETFDKNMTYRKLVDYSDIMALYNDTNYLKDVDIIITTSSYYHVIATTLNSLDINIRRVIFDEIDSISNIIKTKINAEFIWFISASFNPSQLGYYTNKILDDDFENITCKCADEFIDAHLYLEDPLKKYYLCKNIYIDQILPNIVSKKELINLNALDFTLYNNEAEKEKAKSEKEVVELILKNRKSLLDFEKYKVEDANKNIIFYNEFKDNSEKYKNEYLGIMNKVININEFKKNVIELLQNFNEYTNFYLNSIIKNNIESIDETKDDLVIDEQNNIEIVSNSSDIVNAVSTGVLGKLQTPPEIVRKLSISGEMENYEKELKREDLKNFHYALENIIEQLYNITDINVVLQDYYQKKLNKSNIGNLIVNLKKILMLMENVNNVILKIKIELKKNNLENKEIDAFYQSFFDTKNYFQEIILSISNFKHTIEAVEQIDNYNKILEISTYTIDDSNKKIELIYKRLEENHCCPVCYELFEDIRNDTDTDTDTDTDNDNDTNTTNSNNNLIYISSSCCNNKICGRCVTNWYAKNKTSCIFCNTENVGKESMHSYENNAVNNNNKSIEINKIEGEINIQTKQYIETLHIGKNTFIKNFIEKLKNEDKKVIIFSDYSNIFNEIEKMCIENEILYTDLDKGNMKDIDISVQNYKYGNAKILLSNSSLFGCGMNFENSTDIIFVHRMKKRMEEQVIGRAQRIGRKTRLNVYYLQYENEVELDIQQKNNYVEDGNDNEENDIELDKTNNLESFYNDKIMYYSLENLNQLDNLVFDNNIDNNSNIIDNTVIDSLLPIPEQNNEILDINLEELIASLN